MAPCKHFCACKAAACLHRMTQANARASKKGRAATSPDGSSGLRVFTSPGGYKARSGLHLRTKTKFAVDAGCVGTCSKCAERGSLNFHGNCAKRSRRTEHVCLSGCAPRECLQCKRWRPFLNCIRPTLTQVLVGRNNKQNDILSHS